MNSYLVLGDKEALVVDGQFFKADATKVVDLIKASGKTLTAVFLTHAHPDHYYGDALADGLAAPEPSPAAPSCSTGAHST